MRCWCGYLSEARCKWLAYGPADATATPVISCFIKIQNSLTFLVPAYPGCPGKEAVERTSVCDAWLHQCGLLHWLPGWLTGLFQSWCLCRSSTSHQTTRGRLRCVTMRPCVAGGRVRMASTSAHTADSLRYRGTHRDTTCASSHSQV